MSWQEVEGVVTAALRNMEKKGIEMPASDV